jgi:hypothetical protein
VLTHGSSSERSRPLPLPKQTCVAAVIEIFDASKSPAEADGVFLGSEYAAYGQRHGREPADADGARGGRTQIDHASMHEWTAIVDADHHRPPIAPVDDGNTRAEWQGPMRRGEFARPHMLTARRTAAAVHRSHATGRGA